MNMILYALGIVCGIGIGYAWANVRWHRAMSDAWLRCSALTKTHWPKRVDAEWLEYSKRALDQFAPERYTDNPFRSKTVDGRTIR